MAEKALAVQRVCKNIIQGLQQRKLPVLQAVNNNDIDAEGEEEGHLVDPLRVMSVDPRTTKGLRKYCQVIAIMALVSKLLAGRSTYALSLFIAYMCFAENRTMLLRDVYYALKQHFDRQEECNTIILQVGRLLGLKRRILAKICLFTIIFLIFVAEDEMNIIPGAKGLISGPIRFRFSSGNHTINVESSSH